MFTTYLSNKMIGPRAQSPTGVVVGNAEMGGGANAVAGAWAFLGWYIPAVLPQGADSGAGAAALMGWYIPVDLP